MIKGKFSLLVVVLLSALVAFGVIDKEAVDKILGSMQGQETVTSQQSAPATEQGQATAKPSLSANRPTKAWHGWSNTQPQINLSHIFQGEINRRGKPTGFHSRPRGMDSEYARVVRIKSHPNRAGVYTAQVEIFDPEQRRWKEKFSTLFPDDMSSQRVVDSILHAWNNRDEGRSKPWRGPSGSGFQIEGYVSSRGGINTAYPIYQRN